MEYCANFEFTSGKKLKEDGEHVSMWALREQLQPNFDLCSPTL